MFVRQPTTQVNTPRLDFDARDVAITASSNTAFRSNKDRDIAMSNTNLTANNDIVQVHQTEFDWINNNNAFQRIKHLSTLKDNWDGYGAPEFTKPHIQRALELFTVIQTFSQKKSSFSRLSPFIAPCSDGAILFEWGGKRFPNRELEIFVPANLDDPFEYLKSDRDDDVEGNFIDVNFATSLLDWLEEAEVE